MKKEFLAQMKVQLGAELPKFLDVLEEKPITSIRFNSLKNKHLDIKNKVYWCKNGSYLAERPTFTLDPLLHAGAYYVQEASSMFLAEALRQTVDLEEKPLKVLDLCAAPGGKSTLIASLLNEKSLLVGNETIKSRCSVLKENLIKWGNVNVVTTQHDAADFQKLENFFDVLVVDAPCSGEGLFRKTPAARAEWSQEVVSLCAARQKRIVADAMPCLKDGGILIYSTCTYNDFENMENAFWFTQNLSLSSVRLSIEESSWGIVEKTYKDCFGYQFYPHLTKGEGFFITCFTKSIENKQKKHSKNNNSNKKNNTDWRKATKKEREILEKWLRKDLTIELFINSTDEVFAIPTCLVDAVSELSAVLWRKSIGVHLGVLRREAFVPSHDLALSTIVSEDLPKVAVNRSTALEYLKKDNIHLDTLHKGWVLVCYEGRNLGWAKVLQDRTNNYYPKEWRIRMATEVEDIGIE